VAANTPSILVISHPQDKLSDLITANLYTQGVRTLHFSPGALGSRQISLQRDFLCIDGLPIYGMLLRVSPESTFSDDYEINDQSFCNAEIRAILLAALNLDSMLAVNKYDAMTWFEGLNWPTWRRRLIHADIPVSEFLFGDTTSQTSRVWHPYTSREAMPVPGYHVKRILGSALAESVSAQSSLMIAKEIIAGKRAPSIFATAELLANSGVCIAEIVSDINNNILTVNTLPTISDVCIENIISDRIMEMFHAHLHCG
jgi:hypothetical protein